MGQTIPPPLALRAARDTQGKPFQLLAQESGNQGIVDLFG